MKQVTIYSTPTCVYCKMAKEYFKQNKVEYAEKDVSQDHDALHEMVEKSGQMGVPVIDIGGKVVVGYNLPEIKQLLAKPA